MMAKRTAVCELVQVRRETIPINVNSLIAEQCRTHSSGNDVDGDAKGDQEACLYSVSESLV